MGSNSRRPHLHAAREYYLTASLRERPGMPNPPLPLHPSLSQRRSAHRTLPPGSTDVARSSNQALQGGANIKKLPDTHQASYSTPSLVKEKLGVSICMTPVERRSVVDSVSSTKSRLWEYRDRGTGSAPMWLAEKFSGHRRGRNSPLRSRGYGQEPGFLEHTDLSES